MERSELLSDLATKGGSLLACGVAPPAFASESTMLFIIAAIGAVVSVLGLVYSIWNGNRNFKLAQEQLDVRRRELHGGHVGGPAEST